MSIMKAPAWMEKRGITWPDLIKGIGAMGLLMFITMIMIAGAVGAIFT